MRTVFFGTPAIAVPALRALNAVSEVVGVVCQPDRPAGRGLALHEPEVKLAARELGLDVVQPVRVRDGSLARWLDSLALDAAIVMAYGRILPPDVLAAPRRGCLNLHASLLPRWRGAAPIQWAILEGDAETGISLMQMDAGLDTGPVFCRRATPIAPFETAPGLADRLAALAAEVVREDLPGVLGGAVEAVAQPADGVTHAPPLDRGHGVVDWAEPATRIDGRFRATLPWPGCSTTIDGKSLKLLELRAVADEAAGPAGRVSVVGRRVLVATGAGAIELLRAQLAGRRPVGAADLIHGRVLREGAVLGAASGEAAGPAGAGLRDATP